MRVETSLGNFPRCPAGSTRSISDMRVSNRGGGGLLRGPCSFPVLETVPLPCWGREYTGREQGFGALIVYKGFKAWWVQWTRLCHRVSFLKEIPVRDMSKLSTHVPEPRLSNHGRRRSIACVAWWQLAIHSIHTCDSGSGSCTPDRDIGLDLASNVKCLDSIT